MEEEEGTEGRQYTATRTLSYKSDVHFSDGGARSEIVSICYTKAGCLID